MTDEHFSPSLSAPPPPGEADYEAIAAAVMGTVRGRWFLAEFAKRNRNADSALILERIERIDKLLQATPATAPAVSPAERMRIDLVEMAKAIARTRSEIAAIKPDGDAKGTLSEASEELGSIVQATERATSDILAAAEQVQEIAWMLRERGADGAICDALDRRATDVYSACSFQDLTGQRTRKVVDVLQFLEDRIRAMIEIWGGAMPAEDGPPPAVAAPHIGEDRTVPHLEQQDIDRMMPSARPARPGEANARPGPVAATAVAVAGPAGGGGAAEPVTVAKTVLTPAVAIVGATALALDLTPAETARQPEFSPEIEVQAEPASEPEVLAEAEAASEGEPRPEAALEAESALEAEAPSQAEAKAEPEPEPDPAPHPAPAAEAILEPTPEIDSDAAPSEPRTDPAAVLKRILAIIRAPNEPAAGSVAAQNALTASLAAGGPAEPVAAPMAEAAATAAAVSILAPAVADIDSAGPHRLAVDAVAEHMPAGGAAQPGDPVEDRTAQGGVIDEAADDILMPLPGPLTVDQAVDAMLTAPGRIDSAPPPVPAEPAAREAEPAVAGSQSPLVIETPAFMASMPAPVPPAELAPEPASVAETVAEAVAAPLAGPVEPAPPALTNDMRSAPRADAPAAVRPAEPAVQAVAAALGPLVTPAPPATPPPIPPLAALPAAPPRSARRHPALAAITALTDEEKIALFS